MASYKYKVIKGGKVIGEATTRAEAEAAAKKLGGHVAEIVAATTGRRGNPAGQPQPTAKGLTGGQYLLWLTAYGNAMTTRGVDKRQAMQSVRQFTADAIAGQPIRVTDDVKLAWSAVHFDGQPTPAALRAGARAAMKPLIESEKTRNPPLEPHSAATLLDAVKPGAPQQIHGVKVARVGAGYSVDGKAMTRAEALKALEVGRKAKSPRKPNTGAAPRIQTVSGGVPGWTLPAKHLVRIWFDNGKVVEDEVFAFSERAAIAAYAGQSYGDPSLRWPEAGSDPVKVVKVEIAKKANPKQNARSGGSTMSADDYVRFCHAYAIARVLEGESKDRALLAVRQLGTLAQNSDPIRIDRTIQAAWKSAKLAGKPTEKALHDGAATFVSSMADREANPKSKPTTAKASGRKIQYV